jgi:hypothetical protein
MGSAGVLFGSGTGLGEAKESVPVSIMVPLKVSRSTTAQRRGSVKVLVQPARRQLRDPDEVDEVDEVDDEDD